MSTPTVDLDLPTDAQLGTAARPDPQAAAAPLNGMRPDELREHSRRMIASGAAADRAFAATTAAQQQVGRGFTNDGAPVYDADGAAARAAPEIGDMGTLAYTAGRRLAAAADELDDTLTAVRRALEGLQDDLALRRRGFAAEVDAARGPGGLIPVDAAAGLLARRAAVALRLQESVDDCGRTIAARVARFEDVLVGVLPPVRELVARGPTRDAATAATDPGAGPFARLEGSTSAPTGPTAEVQPLPDLRPPDRGFTPGFEGGPLITLPAPDLGLGVQDGPGSDPGAGLPRVQVDAAGPAHVPGPLGKDYAPGVHDPDGRFLPKERAIAERLLAAEPGARVDPLPEANVVAGTSGVTTPDALVRRSPDDPGTPTEFKTPRAPTSLAVQRSILEAGDQLHRSSDALPAGGDVYVDGRAVGLTEQLADEGRARALGSARASGDPLPDRVRVILGDGTIKNY